MVVGRNGVWLAIAEENVPLLELQAALTTLSYPYGRATCPIPMDATRAEVRVSGHFINTLLVMQTLRQFRLVVGP